ncbi:hypothetical protein [Actinomadura rupiterrae]|uniref:hypothetical protein n=1 Tax=Actinomadura rupiterrae TaxID=559627 RepID=UPI0020A4E641|nr:hypothetical protein [Actinomadura rupiterrae]MCP2337577.1 hypothetical protein [Actinomadura rupiterrae]
MSNDVIALLREAPDEEAIVAALAAVGPDVEITVLEEGGAIEVREPGRDEILILVEAPIQVRVDGELERLLGPEVAHVEPPVWWVEVHGNDRVVNSDIAAMRFAGELSLRAGGSIWPEDPAFIDRAGFGSLDA